MLVGNYKGVVDIVSRYWTTYGGWYALIGSPYLHFSFVISIFLYPLWIENCWTSSAVSALPNIIGFSLGGYAVMLAIGDENFKKIISKSKDDEGPSAFLQMSVSFVHFIVVEIVAFLVALACSAYLQGKLGSSQKVASYIGFTTFIYAIFSAFAVTMAVLRLTSWYDRFNGSNHE